VKRAGLNVLPGLAEVPVKLRVIIGSSEISLHDAANLTQKSLLPLGSTVNDPVDIVVNGQLIARGKLVVVDDSYGVQITELVG
jgi:flagellar motor switch protein FliN/FliY